MVESVLLKICAIVEKDVQIELFSQKNCFILVYMFWYIWTFAHVLASFSMKAKCLASLHLFSGSALVL
jgi:hypothetical protein